MSILKLLGFAKDEAPSATGATETVRKIVRELDRLPAERARFLAAFAYLLSRVANADLEISAAETAAMERIVSELGGLPEEQAVLVVEIAKTQNRLFGGTENFLVAREFKEIASPEERSHLLDCLTAVSAADESVSSAEESVIRQITSELGFTPQDFVTALARVRDKRAVLRGLARASTS